MVGASLLWVGWFGFNAGSALEAGGDAGMTMLATHLAAATATCVWIAIERIRLRQAEPGRRRDRLGRRSGHDHAGVRLCRTAGRGRARLRRRRASATRAVLIVKRGFRSMTRSTCSACMASAARWAACCCRSSSSSGAGGVGLARSALDSVPGSGAKPCDRCRALVRASRPSSSSSCRKSPSGLRVDREAEIQGLDFVDRTAKPAITSTRSSTLKLVIAIIQTYRLDAVREALLKLGIEGMTVTEVRGYGRQKGHKEVYRGAEYAISFVPKLKIEVAVADDRADEPSPPFARRRVRARSATERYSCSTSKGRLGSAPENPARMRSRSLIIPKLCSRPSDANRLIQACQNPRPRSSDHDRAP